MAKAQARYQRNPVVQDIHARRPVNRLAAEVMAPGFAYESAKRVTEREWRTCPPTGPIPPTLPDLRGARFGRFVVVGWFRDGNGLWVVRCACGTYATRRTKSVRNPANAEMDRCQQCRHVAHLRRTSVFIATGKTKETDGWEL